jgi:hypothetical protein
LSLGDERIVDKVYQDEARKHREDIIAWWKKKYNYSSNDSRYLTATLTQIYEDFLEEVLKNYNKEIGNHPQVYNLYKGRFLHKDYDKQLSENFKEDMKKALGIV